MTSLIRSLKRLRAKHWIVISVIALSLLHYFGVFIMVREQSFNEFKYPLEGDLSKYISEMKRGDKPSMAPIYHHDYYFDKHPKEKCLTEDQNHYEQLRLVYLVKSAASHFDRRETIRRTWGFENRFADVAIRTVFLLGRVPEDFSLQGRIEQEHQHFQDIVQGSFTDNYYNNSLKAAMGMRWAAEYCSRSRFYMFVDDDYYVSTRNMLRFLRNPVNYPQYLEEDVISFDEDKQMFPRHRVRRNHRSLNQSLKSLNNSSEKFENKIKSLNNSSERFNDKNIGIKSELNGNGTNAASRKLQQLVDFDVPQDIRLFAGFVFPDSRPHRHRLSKWFIPLVEYPFNRWPAYVTAGAYVLSRVALIDMYYTSYFTKLFRFDDIWMGLIAKKADLEPFHASEFHFYRKQYSARGYKYVVASHGFGDPKELSRVWNQQKEAGNA